MFAGFFFNENILKVAPSLDQLSPIIKITRFIYPIFHHIMFIFAKQIFREIIYMKYIIYIKDI